MTVPWDPYVALLVGNAALLAALAALAWGRRLRVRGARAFGALCLAGAVWVGGDMVAWAGAPAPAAVAAVRLAALASLVVPLMLLLFAIDLGRAVRRPGAPVVALLALVPVAAAVAELSRSGGVLWRAVVASPVAGVPRLAGVPGSWSGVQAGYTAGLVAAALALIALARRGAPTLQRSALDWALAGIAVPLAAAGADALGAVSAPGGVTPFVLGLGGALMARGIWGGVVADRPEAWSATAVEHLPDPVLVVDAEQRVRSANAAARAWGEGAGVAVVGADARMLWREHPSLLGALERREVAEAELVAARTPHGRAVRASVTPFLGPRGRLGGRVVRLLDVTVERGERLRMEAMEARAGSADAAVAALAALAAAPDAPLEERLGRVLNSACRAVGVAHGCVYKRSDDGELMVPVAGQGRLELPGPVPVRRGEGAVGRAWRDEGAVLVEDALRWEGAVRDRRELWMESLLALPVWSAGRLDGVLLLARGPGEGRPLGAAQVEAGRPLAQLVGLAMEREGPAQRGRRAAWERDHLVQVAAAAAAGRSGALGQAVRALAVTPGVTSMVVWRVTGAGALEPVAWAGLDLGPEARASAAGYDLPLLAEVVRTGRELVFPPGAPLPQRFRALGPWSGSPLAPGPGAAAIPLLRRGRCIGVTVAGRSEEDAGSLDVLRRGAVVMTLALLLAPPPERSGDAGEATLLVGPEPG